MKKIVLSAVVSIALGSFAVAGGDIAPVAPIVEPAVEGNWYVGAGFSPDPSVRITEQSGGNSTINEDYEALMLQVGYKFNPYIAIEGRYWYGLEEAMVSASNLSLEEDTSLDIWALYVKPMYPVTEQIDVYGLLGYSSTSFDVSSVALSDVDGFSWGAGASYSFTDNWSAFADYVSNYEDDNTLSDDYVYSYNLGVTYTF